MTFICCLQILLLTLFDINLNKDKRGKRYPICGPEGFRCLGKLKSNVQFSNGKF